MYITYSTIILLTANILVADVYSDDPTLSSKSDVPEHGNRVRRQSNADQMVQNILQWLQGVYTQNTRKIRQGSLRQYLPPVNTQKPRPFEPMTPTPQPTVPGGGYPPAGSITPKPPFTIYTNPVTGGVTGGGYPGPDNNITPPVEKPGYNEEGQYPGVPGPPTGYPSYQSPNYPSTGYVEYSTAKPGFPTGPPPEYPSSGYPDYTSSKSTFSPGYTSAGYPDYSTAKPGFPTRPPPSYTPAEFPEYTTSKPGFPTEPPVDYSTTSRYSPPTSAFSTQPPTKYPASSFTTQPSTNYPTSGYSTPSTKRPQPTEQYTSAPASTINPLGTEENTIPPGRPATESTDEDDLRHPPHIHAIDVQCAKDMMTINIEFNRQFDGVIYSKGYYNNPECRYVSENSGQNKYSFTVSLNSCGTEFINAFDTQGQSYLENVLVLQNEPGIQEVWDTIRSVRCLWEGNLKESLSVALSVGMLNQEIVTFSGDTAMAKLDILSGKGPFGPPANGLIKIGEAMTLVVSVSGDPGFDIQVKDCRAKDSTGNNVVSLTDENGCILKPKLFGAFQKTRNTGNTGASIIAYAYFNAFKFPDVMDLMIECNVELCKTDCQMCLDPNQLIDPKRRKRRDVSNRYQNKAIGDAVTMGKHLRVILPQDLNHNSTFINLSTQEEHICMSTQSFVLSTCMLITLLTTSCLFSAYMWLKTQRLVLK